MATSRAIPAERLARLVDVVGPTGLLTGADAVRLRGLGRPGTEARPEVLVRPKTTAAVAEVLALCNQWRLPVVTQGGLTGLVDGAIPGPGELALSLESMNLIEELDGVQGTLLAQAGVPLAQAQEAAAAAGWMLPLDLGGRGSATLGGNVATNAGGNRVLRYGMTRNLVMGLEVVLADGTVLSCLKKVLKDNTGYDLNQLFVGSEGTLGVITRVLLRLVPKPVTRATALVALDDFPAVVGLLQRMRLGLQGQLTAFEVMWQSFYRCVTEPPAPHRAPISGAHAYYVLVEALGNDPAIDGPRFEGVLEQAVAAGQIADAVVAKSEGEIEALWAMRDDVAQVARHHPLVGFDISLPVDAMEEYLRVVHEELRGVWPHTQLIVFGHLGDGNLHLVVSMREDCPAERQRVERCVYLPLQTRGGSISAEHGVGLQKKPYLEYSRSQQEIEVMRRVKRALDPNLVLNPGRIFDAMHVDTNTEGNVQ